MTQQEYISLVNEANKHSYLYYVESNPTISDAEFDAMLVEIGRYEQAHPDHILPDSPTQCVGSDINGNGRRLVTHRSPMLSQQKAHSIDDIKAFMASVESVLGYTPSMRIEWKYDGVSCSIVYIDGQLVSAATRGDGQRGQDITDHVKAMPSVPSAINQSGRVEVRGEVVCPKGQHITLGYKDERTAASAILNTAYSDSAKTLVFIPWEAIGEYFHTFSDTGKLAIEFPSVVSGYTVNGIQAIEDAISRLSANRPANYPVDGLVIKIDYRPDFEKMGANQHHPKGSIAYKFAPASAVATVLGIKLKVAKSGRRTPVAHITPVVLMGKTVSKVNLFSERIMNDLGIVAGSTVKVTLQNDVTPKITAVLASASDTSIPDTNTPDTPSHGAESVSSRSASDTSDDIAPIDYWEREGVRLNDETARIFAQIEEQQTALPSDTAAKAAEVSTRPNLLYPINPTSDDDNREPDTRPGIPLTSKIGAALAAVAIVSALFVLGAGAAAFFAPLLAGVFSK